MGLIHGQKVKQVIRDDYEINPNTYRVNYNEETKCFELFYGVYDKNKEEMQIHSKVNINSNFFIQYFMSILDSLEEYNGVENDDIIEKIIERLNDEEDGDINES